MCLNEKCVLLIRLGLPTTADISKVNPRTTNYVAATVIEGAESLVSLRPQAVTSVDGDLLALIF